MGAKPTGFAPFSIAARCHEETHASQQLADAVESLTLVSTGGVGPIPDTPAHPTRRLPLDRRPPDRHQRLSGRAQCQPKTLRLDPVDRKSTRLNSSHGYISYAVFCLKKK